MNEKKTNDYTFQEIYRLVKANNIGSLAEYISFRLEHPELNLPVDPIKPYIVEAHEKESVGNLLNKLRHDIPQFGAGKTLSFIPFQSEKNDT